MPIILLIRNQHNQGDPQRCNNGTCFANDLPMRRKWLRIRSPNRSRIDPIAGTCNHMRKLETRMKISTPVQKPCRTPGPQGPPTSAQHRVNFGIYKGIPRTPRFLRYRISCSSLGILLPCAPCATLGCPQKRLLDTLQDCQITGPQELQHVKSAHLDVGMK